MGSVKPVPEGIHTITPSLNLKGVARAIEFYAKAFGAEEIRPRMFGPSDQIVHAELKIGDSVIYLSEAQREPETRSEFTIYSADSDAAFNRAVAAGAKVAMPPTTMFWGDRMGRVVDAWENSWVFMTHVADVTADELEKGRLAFFEQLKAQGKL